MMHNCFVFPGQYFDQETGLHYNFNRYYSSSLGKYITSDPIGIEGGLNTYSYAVQNPNNRVDPRGTGPISGGICYAIDLAGTVAAFYELKKLNDELDAINKEIAELEKICLTPGQEEKILNRLQELYKERNRLATKKVALIGGMMIGTPGLGIACTGLLALPVIP